MKHKDPNEIVRTTVYMPRSLHEKTKLMAIFVQCGLSDFIRISIKEKLDQITERHKNKKDVGEIN